jgi:hypothetical protein
MAQVPPVNGEGHDEKRQADQEDSSGISSDGMSRGAFRSVRAPLALVANRCLLPGERNSHFGRVRSIGLTLPTDLLAAASSSIAVVEHNVDSTNNSLKTPIVRRRNMGVLFHT